MAEEKEPRGFRRYIRAAFLQPWNLLLFFGSIGMTVVTGTQDIAPFIMAAELAFVTGLASMPRFRTAIDAKIAARARAESEKITPAAELALQRMVASLPNAGLRRFLSLRQRCYEMRDIAAGIRGHQADSGDVAAEAMRNSSLDRLLFLFLKLLVSQAGLERFLNTTSERELELRLQDVQARRAQAQEGGDERIVRSLQDSEADAGLRLENYRKSLRDAEFVNVELDRIETKIRTLVEMAVGRQDPDTLSVQVTAAADSMKQTEDAVRNLQHLTGIESAIDETPPILAADMSRVLSRESR